MLLQGRLRQYLLMLTTLFFAVLYLEVVLGHQGALSQHRADAAVFPIVIVPLGLLAVVWAQVRLSMSSEAALEAAMGLAVLVGLIGFVVHLQVSGVGWDHPSRLFAANTWRGPACPNWPLAISFAGALGAFAGYGMSQDTGYAAAVRAAAPLSRAVLWTACALLAGAVPLVFVPALSGTGLTAVVAVSVVLTTLLLVEPFWDLRRGPRR